MEIFGLAKFSKRSGAFHPSPVQEVDNAVDQFLVEIYDATLIINSVFSRTPCRHPLIECAFTTFDKSRCEKNRSKNCVHSARPHDRNIETASASLLATNQNQ